MMRFALLFAGCMWCASPLDQAIVTQMGQARIATRTPVSSELDLVVAYASPENIRQRADGSLWWGGKMKLGIFLQQRDEAGLVYKIAVEDGPDIDEGLMRMERATATDVLFLCSPEKGRPGPYVKFVYDIRAKALVKTVRYKPYSMNRVVQFGGKTIAVGEDRERPVAVEFAAEASPPFRLLSGAEALRLMKPEGKPPDTRVALPKSSYDDFAAARPESAKYGPRRGAATFDERIGPWQLAEGTLWFGKTFYDGEGHTGVGGFGYFDAARNAYKLFSPAAVRYYSVSAILVGPEAVWLGLVHHGEWGDSGGGLVRFDRATERTERFDLREIVSGIARVGDRMVLATEGGVAVLEAGRFRRYIVDETTDGRLRILELIFGQQ